MKYNYNGIENLTKPTDFDLVTQQDLFEELVNDIDSDLSDQITNTYYDGEDSHVEVIIENDDLYSKDIINDVQELFCNVGWSSVTYEHKDETEDDCASHRFKFYFSRTPMLGL